MNLSRLAIRRPVTTGMVFVSLLVLGLVAAQRLPLEFFPEVEVPFLFIQVPYPGSSPRQVEESITRPLEESLATLKGIYSMNSNSRADQAQIFIRFDWGEKIGPKALEARARIDAVRHLLPDDVQRIQIFRFNSSDAPVMTLRISSQRDLSQAWELLQRRLIRPLQRLEGVARVELQGVEPMEIRIQLDRERLDAHGLQAVEVLRVLRQHNFNISAGQLEGETRWQVMVDDRWTDPQTLRDWPLGRKGLRLGDVAEIRYAPKERDYGRHLDMRYAVGVQVFKESGANMVDVGRRVLEEIDRIGQSPEMQGIQLFFLNNQAEGVKTSLADLLKSGLLGALLSLLVLYAFLRDWLTTLTVSLAVPVSVLITLGAMYFLGVSLNILSMMGLMLAVGMLVDNAVVVAESIFALRQQGGHTPFQAAEQGSARVGVAVFAGTLTSMIVFLPNIFGDQDQISLFLSHVALAITLALGVSLLISLTVIPMITARMRHVPVVREGALFHRLQRWYQRWMAWSLRRRGRAGLILLLVLLASAVPVSGVHMDMFPDEDGRELQLQYNLHGSYPLEVVEAQVLRVEKYLYANQKRFEIKAVYSFFNHRQASSTILLTEQNKAHRAARQIKRDILKGLPALSIGRPGFEFRRQGGRDALAVQLRGESTSELYRLAEQARRQLAHVPGVVDASVESGPPSKEVQLLFQREKALRFGLNSRDIAQRVGAGLRGVQLGEWHGPEGEVPIQLRFREEQTRNLDDLRQLRLDGRVPLGAVSHYQVVDSPGVIRRSNRQTTLRVRLGLEEGADLKAVRQAIEQVMGQMKLPNGYGWALGRGFQDDRATQQTMLFNMLVAVALIYLLLAALFESLLLPVTMVFSIVFGVLGVFWLFWISGTTFSLMAMIGILILIGVVVNNGIVLIDHINQLRWQGQARDAAVLAGGADRLRPILMTVATTVLGLLPLALGDTQVGGDGPPYYPMARAIIGGLSVATVLGLMFMPWLYTLLDDLAGWWQRLWQPLPLAESTPGKD